MTRNKRVPRIVPLRTLEDWDDCIARVGNGLLVALFGASWSDPCQRTMSTFTRFASDPEFVNFATFALVDADDEILFAERRIKYIPCYQQYWLGEMVSEFSGTDELKLLSETRRLQDAIINTGTGTGAGTGSR